MTESVPRVVLGSDRQPIFYGPAPDEVVIQFTPRQDHRLTLGECQAMRGNPLEKGGWVNHDIDLRKVPVRDLATAGFGYVQFVTDGVTISAHFVRKQMALYYPFAQAALAVQMLLHESESHSVYKQ